MNCPFCGSQQVATVSGRESTVYMGYQATCLECGARGPGGLSTPGDALKVFQTDRPPTEAGAPGSTATVQ